MPTINSPRLPQAIRSALPPKTSAESFFSAATELNQQSWLHSTLFTLTLTQCSTFWDLCVIVKHHDAGLASLPPFIFALLAVILCFIWIAITLFIFRIYEDRFSLERTLIKAVITNTISVNYQPIIRIHDQKKSWASKFCRDGAIKSTGTSLRSCLSH